MNNKNSKRVKGINRVTLVGSLVNMLLALGKIIAGFVGKSSAMIADGFHSFSDLATDIVVLVFVGIADRDIDSSHRYGHGKFETFATMLISFALTLVAAGILWNGSEKVIHSLKGAVIDRPGIIALYAALASIISKEVLYWYTRRVGVKLNSQAVIANAWHHRSDALSSIGTALGISGAIFLGEQWRILDPLAGIIVSFFILRVAWKIGIPSIKELLESSLSEEIEKDISALIRETGGVRDFHNLRTRKIGEAIAVDVHVKVDKELSVESSHDIASEIEISIREKYGIKSHIGIHIEPYYK